MKFVVVVAGDISMRRALADRFVDDGSCVLPLATGGEALGLPTTTDVVACIVHQPLPDLTLQEFEAAWSARWPQVPFTIHRTQSLDFRFGEWAFRADEGKIDGPQTSIVLTQNETALLRALVAEGGRAVSRAKLLTMVMGEPEGSPSRAVDFTLGRLKKKLRQHGAPDLVISVRGVGLRIREPSTPKQERGSWMTVPALEQLRRACQEGSRLVIVSGAAGSGRSTLLRALHQELRWPLLSNQLPADDTALVDDWAGGLPSLLAWLGRHEHRRVVVVPEGELTSKDAQYVIVRPLSGADANKLWHSQVGTTLPSWVADLCQGNPGRLTQAGRLAIALPASELRRRLPALFAHDGLADGDRTALSELGRTFTIDEAATAMGVDVDMELLDRVDGWIRVGAIKRCSLGNYEKC